MKENLKSSEIVIHLEKRATRLKLVGLISMVFSLFSFMLLDISEFIREDNHSSELDKLGLANAADIYNTWYSRSEISAIKKTSPQYVGVKPVDDSIYYYKSIGAVRSFEDDTIDSQFIIQTNFFYDFKNAVKRKEEFENYDMPAGLLLKEVDGRTGYVVFIGPFLSLDEAMYFKHGFGIKGDLFQVDKEKLNIDTMLLKH